MNQLFDGIAWVLSLFYSIWPSYGGAIILLTLSVMVVMTPLTLKGTKSMMSMQRLQPEMKRIQEKYKDDKEKLNEELLTFYRENNINPVGGCLPLLLQMPIFMVLYRVIAGLTLPASAMGVWTGWGGAQLGHGGDFSTPPEAVTARPFSPAYLDHNSSLYQALEGSYTMPFLGLDLAQSTSQALSEGIVHALPYLVMIAIVALSGWYQQKQTQARNTSEPNPQQQMIGRVMLIFLPAISFGLPAGVVLYFVVSNLYRVGQQAYITRTMFSDDKEPIPAVSAKAEKSKADKSKADKSKAGSAGSAPATKAKGAEGDRSNGAKPVKPKRSGAPSGGRVTPAKGKPAGGGAASGRKSKTFTSDPKRRATPTPPQEATPRPRKKRK